MSGISKVIYGNQVLIDLTGDTVVANKLLSGYTAHGSDGEVINGECTFDADTSDGNATTGEILTGKSAYVGGSKVEGSMPNRGAVDGRISDVTVPYNVQNGYHDGSGTVGVDATEAAKLIPQNLKKDISVLGVTGSYEGEPITAGAISATPYTTAKTYLPQGTDYISEVHVGAIPYLEVTDQVHGGKIVTIGEVDPDV